jgi:hypothetical protein
MTSALPQLLTEASVSRSSVDTLGARPKRGVVPRSPRRSLAHAEQKRPDRSTRGWQVARSAGDLVDALTREVLRAC